MAAGRHDRERDGEAEALLDTVLEGQARAIDAVKAARAAVLDAAETVAMALQSGGRVLYVGVGASGGAALQDYAEWPGTFGLSPDRFAFVSPDVAGAPYVGAGEDDRDLARRTMAALKPGAADAVIAVAASGSTPYTVAAVEEAKARGASIVAVVCRPNAPLADLADVGVVAVTGAEAIDGSTRLAGGTAQKAALGAISTVAGQLLGHVYRRRMVNLRATNAKLRDRAEGIVADLAGVARDDARRALDATGGEVKAAILFALGDADAVASLARTRGDLAAALKRRKPNGFSRGPEARL